MNALITVGDPGHIGENECLKEQEHCGSNQSATGDPKLGSLVQESSWIVLVELARITFSQRTLRRCVTKFAEAAPEEIDTPVLTSSSSSSFTCGCLSSSHALNL